MKIDRNRPCPCGSGKKYKKCCLLTNEIHNSSVVPPEVVRKLQEHRQNEIRRQQLYGKTRPIIHTNHKGYKFVVVGSELHYSRKWKTFPDFLTDYLKAVLGSDWGNMELRKPLEQRHQIMKWYHATYQYQLKRQPDADGICRAVPNGPFAAYLLLAYDLYVLRDHKPLQEQVIKRLKMPDQFQGARHELFAAATCIRGGFDIEFEDETDSTRKHPEFTATHGVTGQKIAVEAKSRHRRGVLDYVGSGRLDASVRLDVTPLINKAIKKNNGHPLVIFVDVNLPLSAARSLFAKQAASDEFKKMLEKVQNDLRGRDLFNLIVFTNHPHHFGHNDEDDPERHALGIFSVKPSIVPAHPQCIIDLNKAAIQYGNIPNEFP